jgi:hypothetical protein
MLIDTGPEDESDTLLATFREEGVLPSEIDQSS